LTDLGTLPGGIGSFAYWINDAGEIVGGSFTANPSSPFHAVLWRRGTITDLGTVDGDQCSGAAGVNSETQVVGFSSVDCMVNSHAFLWENGQIIDLNIFNYPGSGLQQLLLAFNINDRGEIDGLGVPPGCGDPFACGHVFALIPCDEKHDDGEGCQDGRATDTTRGIPAQVNQNPTASTTQSGLPSERMAAIRARLAHRYPYRGFGAYQAK
jgi:probable HAF family extracellular repeat protein